MKPIPLAIARSLADALANISDTTFITAHTFYDTYYDDPNFKGLVKRESKLSTYYEGGVLKASFHIEESSFDKRCERVNIDDVQNMTVDETFIVEAEGVTLTFPLLVPDDPEPEPEPEPGNDGE